MEFLNPAMLAGLGAVSLPVLIHLLNRTRVRRIQWAAMRFLEASLNKNRRRLRVEEIILLLVRCALVALLALALARPSKKIGPAAAPAAALEKSTAVLVLDNSLSMGHSDGVQRRIDAGREAALKAVEAAPRGSRFAILTASEPVRAEIPEPTGDLVLVKRVVRQWNAGAGAGDLFPALRRAADTLRDAGSGRREVVCVTDSQNFGWRHWREIEEMIRALTGEVRFRFLLVDGGETDNTAVTRLDTGSDPPLTGRPVRVEAEVSNFGESPVRDVQISLLAGSNTVDKAVITEIPAGGSVTAALLARFDKPGVHAVTARLREDRLPADDMRTAALRVAGQAQLLLIDGAGAVREGPQGRTFYLRHALAPVAGADAARFGVRTELIGGGQLATAQLDRFAAVFAADVAELGTPAAAGRLAAYVGAGGALVLFPGKSINAAAWNRELGEKLGLLPAHIGEARGEAGNDAKALTLAGGRYEHPVTAVWNQPGAGTLATARFTRSFLLKPFDAPAPAAGQLAPGSDPDAAPTGPAGGAGPARTILAFADGTPAVVERRWGEGVTVLFASTADTSWNDFPLRPGFVPFLQRLLGSLLRRHDDKLNVAVGKGATLRVDTAQTGKTAELFRPGAAAGEKRAIELAGATPVLRYANTAEAGFYRVRFDDPAAEPLGFAAQPDPRESDLRPLAASRATTLGEIAHLVRWTEGASLADSAPMNRGGDEWWFPLALAALALGIGESLLARWFSRSK